MVNVLDELPTSAMRAKWGWFVALGVLLLACSFIAFGNLFIATVVSVYYVGMLMLIGGIIYLVHAFQVRTWEHILTWVLSGLFTRLPASAPRQPCSPIVRRCFSPSPCYAGVLRLGGRRLKSSRDGADPLRRHRHRPCRRRTLLLA